MLTAAWQVHLSHIPLEKWADGTVGVKMIEQRRHMLWKKGQARAAEQQELATSPGSRAPAAF